ncbi:MAG TPA: penicillin acylase family protein [Bacilli bacterium]|nr:penicillin acylase family protein [Bacilli bacterium]
MANSQAGKWINLALSLAVGGGLIYGLSHAIGPVPALAQAFHPVTGVWTSAQNDQLLPHTQDLTVPGAEQEVQVVFEKNGTAHIQANTNRDAWLAIGYVQAHFRLFQMDLMRRQGAGLLSEVIGPGALEADKLQRQLGLTRTAEAEWAAIQDGSEVKEVLEAYAEGVNAVIDEQKEAHTLPMMFKILGYEPQAWKPQDTLLMKGVLAQMMSLNDTTITRVVLGEKLGADRVAELFPVISPAKQAPYDLEPYAKHPLESMPVSAEQLFMEQESSNKEASAAPASHPKEQGETKSFSERLQAVPDFAMVTDLNANSNGWAVSGAKTASGKALLAGDPHLEETLPSVWFELQVDAPDYQFAGATVPGIPLPLIGHNRDISWTMTNGATQQTFFYEEKTDESHPDQYYWNGQWREMTVRQEPIPVKGGAVEAFEVKSTIHGAMIEQEGKPYAIDWLGSIPTHGVDSLLQVLKADDYADFQSAFRDWGAPTMNFVYADRQGDIGLLSAGCYPVFGKDSKPWLPMRGTGEDDIIGRIPFADIPQVYNPKQNYVFSANQRQVGDDYPYYIGTSRTFSAPYRAQRISDLLREGHDLTAIDMQKMQADVYNTLAQDITPLLLESLGSGSGVTLTDREQTALVQLKDWDYRMKTDSIGASVWEMFWEKYMEATFVPWWDKYEVPYKEEGHEYLAVNPGNPSLAQDLAYWTQHEPDNAYFSNPVTGEKREATQVMLVAFQEAVKALTERGGSDVTEWQYGKLHVREIPSMAQVPALGYKERAAGGDFTTLNVAYGWETGFGPTWRMVMDWGTGKSVGIYPGGQSENPASPWYTDRIDSWWSVNHNPMLSFEEAEKSQGVVLWRMLPQEEGAR